MDYYTLTGLFFGAVVLIVGARHGGALSAFVNPHGLYIVIGGTICATMVNCSGREIRGVLRSLKSAFLSPAHGEPEVIIPLMVDLCRQARRGGQRALLEGVRQSSGGEFLSRAAETCVTLGEQSLARTALEREINQMRLRHREVGNVFRTMGLLAPMFGLLGTLIGIISVLRNLTDAMQTGPAMAVAISSAFYGILTANLFCVPIANKLRMRSIQEGLAQEVIMVGILSIVFSQRVPAALEAELTGYLEGRRKTFEQPAE
ncbi:MAG: MotA/TolQ/ExbB proton channel family protein [Elusimicrobiota bacterium]|jgi:chemotaxis protein MotA